MLKKHSILKASIYVIYVELGQAKFLESYHNISLALYSGLMQYPQQKKSKGIQRRT